MDWDRSPRVFGHPRNPRILIGRICLEEGRNKRGIIAQRMRNSSSRIPREEFFKSPPSFPLSWQGIVAWRKKKEEEEGKIWNSEAAEKRYSRPFCLVKLASSFPDDHVPPPLYKSVNCPETNLGEYNRYVLTRASSPLSSLIRRSAVSPRSIRPGLLCRRLESRGHCSRFSRMILTDARGIVIHKTKYTRDFIWFYQG